MRVSGLACAACVYPTGKGVPGHGLGWTQVEMFLLLGNGNQCA